MRKLFAMLLTLALTIAAFTTLSAITVSAEEDGFEHYVTLNVADGPIRIFADHYAQNGMDYEGFTFENTLYTITGGAANADAILRVVHNAEDAAPATVHIVFRDLYIYPQTWCSVVHFTSGVTGTGEDATPVLTVDLRLEGRNYVAGYNHPGISGNAIVNLSAAPDSYSVFTSEYDQSSEAFGGPLVLRKEGDYDVKVNGEIADLEAGKTNRPTVITGPDSAAPVKETIDALPAPSDVTTSDKEAITAARQAYNALSPAKKTEIDAETLGHLTDDEAALAAAEAAAAVTPEPEPEPEPKRAPNLTALWIVLGFLCGAGCAVGVTLFVLKKKQTLSWDDAEPETDHSDTAD